MATALEDLLPLLTELSSERERRRSLNELAREQGRSASHFQRAFARLVGESPKQYGKRLQLECAAALLITTPHTVLRIAIDVGFESHEGFTRAFTRHFGVSPTGFRARWSDTDDAERLRHADLVTHVGPCLRLFRAPVTPQEGARSMSYDITKQSLPALTVLYKEARCTHAEIAQQLGQLLPAVFQYATTAGVSMVGPPMTVYTAWGPGMVTMRAGLAVADGSEGNDEISVMVLPAGDGAVTVHKGSYDGLGDAHAAVEQWIHEQGHASAGALREIYVTDPGEVPNPDDWQTQIVWPLTSD